MVELAKEEEARSLHLELESTLEVREALLGKYASD